MCDNEYRVYTFEYFRKFIRLDCIIQSKFQYKVFVEIDTWQNTLARTVEHQCTLLSEISEVRGNDSHVLSDLGEKFLN